MRERERGGSNTESKRVKIGEGKGRVETVEMRGEDRCIKEPELETQSAGSGFMPKIDNLDVKSYIRCMCLSVTY